MGLVIASLELQRIVRSREVGHGNLRFGWRLAGRGPPPSSRVTSAPGSRPLAIWQVRGAFLARVRP
eukprot:1930654-Alexandrium_andersonii.AAC.1